MPKSLKRILYNACGYNGFYQIMDLFIFNFHSFHKGYQKSGVLWNALGNHFEFYYHMDGGMHHYKDIEWWYTSFKVFIHFIKFYVNLF